MATIRSNYFKHRLKTIVTQRLVANLIKRIAAPQPRPKSGKLFRNSFQSSPRGVVDFCCTRTSATSYRVKEGIVTTTLRKLNSDYFLFSDK